MRIFIGIYLLLTRSLLKITVEILLGPLHTCKVNLYMCAPKYLTHTLSLGLECDKNKGIFYSCFFQQKITSGRKYQNI